MVTAIINFIKKEFSGWNKFEKIIFPLLIATILIITISLKDHILAIITAITGITYTFLAGKGRISCYGFSIITSTLYSYIAFKNHLFGNMALNLFYYLPMAFVGIFKWKSHLKEEVQEIEKTKLSTKERIIYLVVTTVAVLITYFILKYLNDQTPMLDSITTILSIVGLLLTVKRCIEQWYAWFVVNGLTAIMWIIAYINGSNCFATVLMWCTYWVIGIYFLTIWYKELNNEK